MSYETKNIRNVCFLGHNGSGKTTLTESMLYLTGGVDRQGKVTDGNTVCDYDPEEIRRQITISAAIAPIDYSGTKINVLDCPGFFDFSGEVKCVLRAADAGLIVCTAKDGLTVGTERAWKHLKNSNLPVMFYISKTDEENGNYEAVLKALQEKYGSFICALTIPTSDGTGVIDLVNNVAYQTTGNKTTKIEIPAADADTAAALREALMETAAGADEELMEVYFDTMELSGEQLIKGIKTGVAERTVMPVLCGSAIGALGTQSVLQAIADYAPNPAEAGAVTEDGPTAAFVFKTNSDQFGKYSLIKVMSGKLSAEAPLKNSRTQNSDKLGRLYTICGKKNTEVKSVCCGDLAAVGKMDWKTGDTVYDPKHEVEFERLVLPEPGYSMAVYPKVKGQEDKIASGLIKLNEEDISFRLTNNAETHQMVISALGDIQIDVLCAKIKARYGVETELHPARVPYREKLKGKVEVHGRHKKQSGGSGQFGDVWIRFESQEESEEMVFAEEVFGGSVPRNFFPAVEKGLRDAVHKGCLAGYPLVNLKATLYDGSYHPVDSNEMAFKTAAQIAYKEGIPNAKPTILEPIGALAVSIPSDYMGDIIGDLNKRRGRVMGMNPDDDGNTVVEAEVPMAEMSSYTIDLRSMTQGRGSFTLVFERYEEAPGPVQQKVIEDAKALAE